MSFRALPVLVRGRTVWDQVQLPAAEFALRHQRVRELMAEKKIDGLLIYANGLVNGPVCYLTSFHCYLPWADALYVFPIEGNPVIIASCSPRNVELNKTFLVSSADLRCAGLSLVSNHHLAARVVDYLSGKGMLRQKWGGVNLGNLSFLASSSLRQAIGEIPDFTAEYDHVRAVKDASEISIISQSAQMAKRAALELIRACRPGTSEFAAVALVDRKLRWYGVEEVNVLLAAGKECRHLHLASGRRFAPGDLIQVYVAIKYLRYWGVFGTSAVIGQPTEDQKNLYVDLFKGFTHFVHKIAATMQLAGDWLSDIPTQAAITPYSNLNGIGLDLLEEPYIDVDKVQTLLPGTVLNLTLGLAQDGVGSMLTSATLLAENEGISMLSGPLSRELLFSDLATC